MFENLAQGIINHKNHTQPNPAEEDQHGRAPFTGRFLLLDAVVSDRFRETQKRAAAKPTARAKPIILDVEPRKAS